MSEVVKRTTVEAAKYLNVSVPTFRIYVRIAGIVANEVIQTGKRGRPADLWTGTQIAQLRQLQRKYAR